MTNIELIFIIKFTIKQLIKLLFYYKFSCFILFYDRRPNQKILKYIRKSIYVFFIIIFIFKNERIKKILK